MKYWENLLAFEQDLVHYSGKQMVRQPSPIRDNIFPSKFSEWKLTNIYKRAIARSGVILMTPRPFPRKLIMGLLFLCLFFFSGCSAPPGNPEDGKRWYMMHNCYSCHGLHGDDGRAPRLPESRWDLAALSEN